MAGERHAIFAGGCFWCTQAEFAEIDGVSSVVSGYIGGRVKNPTYEQVSNSTTGHAEAVKITYDPAKVSFESLLDIFWRGIDPTDDSGQFYDRGTQYRTAIFYTDEEQHVIAEASKRAVQEMLKKQVFTAVLPASEFYPAEDYHQDYYKKNAMRYNAYAIGSGRKEKLKQIWGNVVGKLGLSA